MTSAPKFYPRIDILAMLSETSYATVVWVSKCRIAESDDVELPQKLGKRGSDSALGNVSKPSFLRFCSGSFIGVEAGGLGIGASPEGSSCGQGVFERTGVAAGRVPAG